VNPKKYIGARSAEFYRAYPIEVISCEIESPQVGVARLDIQQYGIWGAEEGSQCGIGSGAAHNYIPCTILID
jgi:hypothetical protein